MSENKHLVPLCIIYAEGKRLSTDVEGALKKVVVDDCVNGIGKCILEFDYSNFSVIENSDLQLEDSVSIHMGYKDDCDLVFEGEVADRRVDFSVYMGQRIFITVRNCLYRLCSGRKCRTFQSKTDGAIIQSILQEYNLSFNGEAFGVEQNFTVQTNQTDYDFIFNICTRYGKNIYGDNRTVYVNSKPGVSDEHVVLEWGKTLSSFKASENACNKISGCQLNSWSIADGKSISASVSHNELSYKTGGTKNWTGESKYTDQWKDVLNVDNVNDQEDLKNLASGCLLEQSLEYQNACCVCEGNYRIRPGAKITVKYTGAYFSGSYVAVRVVHELSVSTGYVTQVYLKRNCGGDDV